MVFCFLILFFVCLWVYEYCLWVRKEIKFGYSCFLGKILHSWYRQSSFLHSATPRARDGLSVSRVQDFAEKALVPKLDSYMITLNNVLLSAHRYRISLLLPRLLKFSSQRYSNGLGNLGNLSSNNDTTCNITNLWTFPQSSYSLPPWRSPVHTLCWLEDLTTGQTSVMSLWTTCSVWLCCWLQPARKQRESQLMSTEENIHKKNPT